MTGGLPWCRPWAAAGLSWTDLSHGPPPWPGDGPPSTSTHKVDVKLVLCRLATQETQTNMTRFVLETQQQLTKCLCSV